MKHCKTDFGNKIKILRQEKKLSQRELSKVLGLSENTIKRWENHISEPRILIIIKVSKYFNVSSDYLLKP